VSVPWDEPDPVTDSGSPLPWFSCASESCRLGCLEGSWLAFTPFVLGLSRDRRVLQLPNRAHRPFSRWWDFSSLALRRHPSVSLPRLPRPEPSHVDHDPIRTVPRVSFPALQHFRIQKPFTLEPLPWSQEVSP